MSLLVALGYPASLLMGLALGLTGGGGSILTLPILVYLFAVPAVEATAYSLLIVGLVAAWGAQSAYRSGEMNLKKALSFGIPGVLGVLIARKILLPLVPAQISILGFSWSQNSVLLLCFSLLMLLASISMIRASYDKSVESNLARREASIFLLFSGGLAVGLVAGFVGAGGGFLIVPALVKLGGLDMKQAVGTSLLVIALQSLLGVLGDYTSLLKIDFVLFASIATLAVIGMGVGTRLRKKIPSSKLKFAFGIFVLIMGTLILSKELIRGNV